VIGSIVLAASILLIDHRIYLQNERRNAKWSEVSSLNSMHPVIFPHLRYHLLLPHTTPTWSTQTNQLSLLARIVQSLTAMSAALCSLSN
jgi:hypothetical protein